MYIVIERSPNSFLQTEYHITNETQMRQFIVDKDCDEAVSSEDFSNNHFRENLEIALNEIEDNKKYQVVHIWLN